MATQGGKGKKQQSPAKATKRARCRENAKLAATVRREAQAKRASANRVLRAAGKLTRWELAGRRRRFSRGQFDLIEWTKQGGFNDSEYFALGA